MVFFSNLAARMIQPEVERRIAGSCERTQTGTVNLPLQACRKSLPYEEYYRLCTLISPEVRKDNTFVSEEYMEYIRQKAVISTETAKAVSNKAIDTTLKVGGITDGSKSYGRMVDLLLEYRFYIQE